MTTELRTLTPAEWDTFYATLERAFGVTESKEERELYRDLTEFDRTIGVWEGDRCIGTAGAFSFRLTVPGGASLPVAGVTMVSVAATHRRRGVLTSMMRQQLDDVRARGEAVAVLVASEPVIYGRFGYGVGTFEMRAEIDTARVRIAVPEGTDDVRLRYASVSDAEVHRRCEEIYARAVAGRPGMLARQPGWERMPVLDPEKDRGGATALQCVLAENAENAEDTDGTVLGFARFRVKPQWSAAGADGVVVLEDLEAVGPKAPQAAAALWRFLFDLDLTSKLTARNRPSDDAWLHLVSDTRRSSLVLRDSMHVRLVDVGAALEGRTYRTPVDVVFEVQDAFCPWNEGRWRLTGDAKGAVCVRTADPADLALSVRELGAAYLGGVSLASLAAAGRVRELREGAVAEAAAAFGSDVAPWLPHGF
ncbi:GNAT family N-acetyltransferase [Streptomyces sp. NBC_00237]|uniref:GNAT family N-acetyltransferase n=1 Tax=Streptomyces sp. NBC_00237 TaxID=2975687 RepID=UPI00224CD0F2|nr:GNAT family N-acetyltransferase [Streptomyces sp. NBC_00237]MCX5201217.1 GNAT family N-acetyltransferase [Streptomyces sp. NBC_00237]